MKFNEDVLKKLLQQEKSEWDDSDLSWFDEELLLKFERKKLSRTDHENIVAMMAHDQTVLEHYLHLKQQQKSNEKAQYSFSWQQWLLISFSAVVVVFLIGVSSFDDNVNGEILTRGAAENVTYPGDKANLKEFPLYFLAPNTNQKMRIELMSDGEVVWYSDWQMTAKFVFPLSESNHLNQGVYHWRVKLYNNDEIHVSRFTVVD